MARSKRRAVSSVWSAPFISAIPLPLRMRLNGFLYPRAPVGTVLSVLSLTLADAFGSSSTLLDRIEPSWESFLASTAPSWNRSHGQPNNSSVCILPQAEASHQQWIVLVFVHVELVSDTHPLWALETSTRNCPSETTSRSVPQYAKLNNFYLSLEHASRSNVDNNNKYLKCSRFMRLVLFVSEEWFVSITLIGKLRDSWGRSEAGRMKVGKLKEKLPALASILGDIGARWHDTWTALCLLACSSVLEAFWWTKKNIFQSWLLTSWFYLWNLPKLISCYDANKYQLLAREHWWLLELCPSLSWSKENNYIWMALT